MELTIISAHSMMHRQVVLMSREMPLGNFSMQNPLDTYILPLDDYIVIVGET